MIKNSDFGGFLVSNNVINGLRIQYTYREESSISQLNGWTIISEADDASYVSNPDNFTILGATSIAQISPVILEIFSAKYGTDLFWIYENNVHIGFYDLISDREVTIQEILEI
ncbi:MULTISPECIES: immunity protein Imm33 domain-containing protein [Streptococcus]|uniref:DUF2185 domain-containing protein n=1 Tax=Streptococcus suis TaxID=1307 RepID=A0AAW5LYD2_STRSU|nr:DUF2185 domain-containing protein [Streptococcus suis]MCO8219128.1 DUF2185 domain-containing protein [Streptococcus suis]MCR1233597.1 DUF2185 domain-containing protein [Streptococcus suis]NQI88077.1 DUF2185 domain-containing protein [Streptococcus suis]NQI94071.1 DUF2185 domain-containing protein [Streptococcus suis]NQJ00620.1 DUF2185 domain-containing protein [Streptococcus suis]